MAQPLVFFVGAASSGFGKGVALEALSRGHKAIATSRNSSKLADLKEKGAVTMDLDVTQPLSEIQAIVAEAHKVYGRFDVLINAAGYILEGAVEEASPEETYDSFNTNVFGVINLTRAITPYMRQQHSGTIAHFGSVGSWHGAAGAGVYVAVKWAITGFSESLALELKDFGIDVISIEPGYFRTGFLNPGARQLTAKRLKEYDATSVGVVRKVFNEQNNKQLGDIEKGCKVIVDVLTKKDGKDVPMRLVLGSDAYQMIKEKCESTIALLEEWKDVTCRTDHS
ncbi:uncharacterized protein MYCFIDRAFT_25832 [Pseudocercospora fijiensis CIRAD86]|uniref:NAD(P)-binding protein n=1 Tax=Pseudocercospora fijiensis (strain CIRAD86) TaxID=383855 RepID=N1Q9B8_PSEFD|nr:uncharacterized protein MYCFIDRAFT_25832 [Pseudocercospora fijiensis CIRAD86]EME88386.1 hypothetical protein MYCFIDRAFT_25832 [Pseudocercospora fijiensis CIRAD86]